MQERLSKMYTSVLDKWKSLERKQKIRLSAIIAIVLISIGVTTYLATRPDWVVFVDHRSASEIAQIQTTLNEMGYLNRLTSNGTAIEVLREAATQARVDISTTEIETAGTFTFKDALDFSGMGSTEMIKKASLKRAKESEMSQSLLMFDGVKKAVVALAIPETNNYFIQDTEKASASVVLTTSKTLDAAQAEAIARYIAFNIVGLDMENIEIVDQNANSIYSGLSRQAGGVASEDELLLKRKNELENKIKSVFMPLFDDVKISSNLVFDWDKSKVVSRTVTPPIADSEVGLPSKVDTERQKVQNGNAAAEEGLGANDATTPTYNTGQQTASNLDVKKESNEYRYNEEEKVVEAGVGKLVPDQSSMVIALYRYKEYDQVSMEKGGALSGTWDDFKKNTGNVLIKFNPDEEQGMLEAAQKGAGITDVKIVAYEVPVFVDKIQTPMDVRDPIVFGILAALILLLGYGLLKSSQPDEITEVEPELSVEDLLVSTKMDEAKDAEIQALEDIVFNKESESKRQIEKFVTEKPEAVAQLLRNWINDEWE